MKFIVAKDILEMLPNACFTVGRASHKSAVLSYKVLEKPG